MHTCTNLHFTWLSQDSPYLQHQLVNRSEIHHSDRFTQFVDGDTVEYVKWGCELSMVNNVHGAIMGRYSAFYHSPNCQLLCGYSYAFQ